MPAAGASRRPFGSEVRWLVLPERPAGTEGLSEEEPVPLVTRDAMVGVANVAAVRARRWTSRAGRITALQRGVGVRRAVGEPHLRHGRQSLRGRRVHLAAIPGRTDRPDQNLGDLRGRGRTV
ncbi:nitrile hydratase subunit alpha [Streptomyces sp. NPDC051896]|uniref:nitrile hydratase subunit alpha n=1 Tax=Streptomyces sp. NPDC051896 TaxID=3155416 RepID=UPI003427DA63